MLDLSGKQRLLKHLKDNISKGFFKPGDKIKSTQQLAKEFEITIPTAHEALKKLKEEGLIIRKAGEGTFVAKQSDSVRIDQSICMVVNSDDNTSKIIMSSLILKLQARQIKVDVIEHQYEYEKVLKNHNFDDYFVVIVTDSIFARCITSRFSAHVICLQEIYSWSFKGDVISTNFYQACYDAYKLFQEMDHDNIACLALTRKRADGKTHNALTLSAVHNAYNDAVIDFKSGYSNIIEFCPGEESLNTLTKLFKSADKPSAIICNFDHRALEIIKAANALKLTIPDDLAIISIGNSDFARAHDISSFDIQVDTIISLCFDIIERLVSQKRQRDIYEQHLITPKLVIRSSCGYRKKFGDKIRKGWTNLSLKDTTLPHLS
jgi:DNA-binding LacI/PurR family transcriptional regulator